MIERATYDAAAGRTASCHPALAAVAVLVRLVLLR